MKICWIFFFNTSIYIVIFATQLFHSDQDFLTGILIPNTIMLWYIQLLYSCIFKPSCYKFCILIKDSKLGKSDLKWYILTPHNCVTFWHLKRCKQLKQNQLWLCCYICLLQHCIWIRQNNFGTSSNSTPVTWNVESFNYTAYL